MSVELTPSAKRYALALVRRWKLEDAHANCVHRKRELRMADTINSDGEFVQRPFGIDTYEIVQDKHCELAVITQANHCSAHGTYVGDPYGPDIMCGDCEMGYFPGLYEKALNEARSAQAKATKDFYDTVRNAVLNSMSALKREKGKENIYEWIPESVIMPIVDSVLSK